MSVYDLMQPEYREAHRDFDAKQLAALQRYFPYLTEENIDGCDVKAMVQLAILWELQKQNLKAL